jgi:hypothetical protein
MIWQWLSELIIRSSLYVHRLYTLRLRVLPVSLKRSFCDGHASLTKTDVFFVSERLLAIPTTALPNPARVVVYPCDMGSCIKDTFAVLSGENSDDESCTLECREDCWTKVPDGLERRMG